LVFDYKVSNVDGWDAPGTEHDNAGYIASNSPKTGTIAASLPVFSLML
jgi:hypothetical protein